MAGKTLLCFGLLFLAGGCGLATPAQAITADRSILGSFGSLTTAQLDLARGKRVLFEHRSTGERIHLNGLNCLTGTASDPSCSVPSPAAKYNYPNWTWRVFDAATAPDKITAFLGDVTANISAYDVFGMKFCYLDWWEQDFAVYRDMMLGFESRYPTKKFIWVTQALMLDWNNSPGPASIKTFNSQLRTYAKANNKLLYDVADIESHRADGTACTQTLGGVSYESLCSEWWSDDLGHPNVPGSLRLAKAFWWLMVNMDGTTTITPTVTLAPTATRTPTSTLTPTPAVVSGDANGDKRVDGLDYVIWLNHYGGSGTGAANGDFTGDGRTDGLDYVVWLNHYNP